VPGPAGPLASPWLSLTVGYRNSKDRTFRPMLALLPFSRIGAPRSRAPVRSWRIQRGVASLILVFAHDLPAEVYKRFVDVGSPPRTRLEVGNVPVTGYCECAWPRDSPIVFEIGLVPDENHGHVVVLLDPPDLLPELSELVEG